MKTKLLFFITLLCVAAALPTSFAQDNTQAGLPEGAIARLGKGGINIMRFSPDGTHLAVGTDVGVWLYDVQTEKETYIPHIIASQSHPLHDVLDGEEPIAFTEGAGQVNALAFSQDGKTIASGGIGNAVIQLWHVDTNTIQAITGLSLYVVEAIAFLQDSTTLVSLNRNEIAHWDVQTGSKVTKSQGISGYVERESVVFSQDGSNFAIGTRGGRIRVWDATTGRLYQSLTGHAIVSLLKKERRGREVSALTFSPDGKMLASGSKDKMIQLWNIEKQIKLATLEAHEGWITALAFSADGKTLASGDADKVIKLWDVDTYKERATLLGHKNTISTLTFAPEGKSQYSGCLASGSYDGTIRFWDPENGKELVTFAGGHIESVIAAAFSEDDANLTIAAYNGTVDVWSLQTKHKLTTFYNQQSDATTIALSPDATRFAFQGLKGLRYLSPYADLFPYDGRNAEVYEVLGSIQLWDIINRKEIPGPWQDAGHPFALTFSPDNSLLVAYISGKGILAWEMETGVELFRFWWKSLLIPRLTFSPNGKLLTVHTHQEIDIWDTTTQRELTLPNKEFCFALAFSHDNTTLAHADQEGIVLWNVKPTGIQARGKFAHQQRDYSSVLIFSPDGKNLLNAQGYEVGLWDTNGNDLGTLSGHTQTITTLVFSHDGKMLASGSDDGTVLLWDWEKISTKRKMQQR